MNSLAILLWSATAHAAPVDWTDGPHHFVEAGAQVEHATNLVVSSGWQPAEHTRFSASWSTPVFLLERPVNHALHLSADRAWPVADRWQTTGRVGVGVHHSSTTAMVSTALPLHLSGTIGPRLDRGLVRLRAGVSWTPTAHLKPTDVWLQAVPDAVAGWYRGMGGWWDVALEGGRRLGENWALVGSAGMHLTMRGRVPMPPDDFVVPWTADLRLRRVWTD